MGNDIGFCSITEGICRKEGECRMCSLQHIYVNIEHYAKLHEQGRLIELPCAVGDTVWTYWIDDDRLGVERYKPANEPLCILVKDLWGIKFFATKEEAEEKMIAKLKELEGVKEWKK